MNNLKHTLKTFFSNRVNVVLTIIIILMVGGFIAGLTWWLNRVPTNLPVEEIDLSFQADGPYALLLPRRDGNALNLNIFRVAAYEGISYELAYQASASEIANSDAEGASEFDKIDRGVQGTLNTDNKQSEYDQEILFGTCSKGDTMSTLHCVFDKDVENGTLVLKIQQPYKRGDKTTKIYKMTTTWHLQKPDVALGKITSGDSHFNYITTAASSELATTGYSIVNDLTAAPKLPEGKTFFGKVYGLNVPTAKSLPVGDVSIETLENPPANAKLAVFQDQTGNWEMLDTKIDSNKLSAPGKGAGIYAVLTDK
jgi:hypothetical protein